MIHESDLQDLVDTFPSYFEHPTSMREASQIMFFLVDHLPETYHYYTHIYLFHHHMHRFCPQFVRNLRDAIYRSIVESEIRVGGGYTFEGRHLRWNSTHQRVEFSSDLDDVPFTGREA